MAKLHNNNINLYIKKNLFKGSSSFLHLNTTSI